MPKDDVKPESAVNDKATTPTDPSRRAVIKGAAAVATGAALAGVPLTGFPQIMKREIKDITLRHVGVSYAVQRAIGEQASKDLGFKIEMQNLDTSASITRFVTQPNSVDIADMEGWQVKVAMARKIIQAIDSKKIKEFDGILPIFTTGSYEGRKVSRQGISPYEVMYTDAGATKTYGTETHVDVYRTLLGILGSAGRIRPESPGALLAGQIEQISRQGVVNTFGGGVNEVLRDMVGTIGLGLVREKRVK